VEGKIKPASLDQGGIMIKKFEHSLTPATDDSTAQVKEGFISISGLILPLEMNIKYAIGTFQVLELHSNGRVLEDAKHLSVDPDLPLKNRNEGLDFPTVRGYIYDGTPHRVGLLLRKVEGRGEAFYERFGVLDLVPLMKRIGG
jgi:hypothetical protein